MLELPTSGYEAGGLEDRLRMERMGENTDMGEVAKGEGVVAAFRVDSSLRTSASCQCCWCNMAEFDLKAWLWEVFLM